MHDGPNVATLQPAAAAPGHFCARLSWDVIPDAVRQRAKLLILDALGVGLASSTQPFAGPALAGVVALDGIGPCSKISRQSHSHKYKIAIL